MKSSMLLATVCCLFCCSGLLYADLPLMEYKGLIKDGASVLTVQMQAIPSIVDWNNDGKKDLLVGQSLGNILLLINTGTDATPVFTSSVFIQSGGSKIDVGDVSAPLVVDLDGDGKKDLLVGEKEGNLHFFKNVGTDDHPAFSGKTLVETDGKIFDCSWYSRPNVTDWENDGVPDLLCGTSNGYVGYIKVIGSLELDDNTISAATGGAVNLSLDAGDHFSSRGYYMMAGVTGTSPGFPLPGGLIMPLNFDVFTNLAFTLANTPAFANFYGALDASGTGSAQFNTLNPLDPQFVGLSFYFADLLFSPFDFVSNGAQVLVVP